MFCNIMSIPEYRRKIGYRRALWLVMRWLKLGNNKTRPLLINAINNFNVIYYRHPLDENTIKFIIGTVNSNKPRDIKYRIIRREYNLNKR